MLSKTMSWQFVLSGILLGSLRSFFGSLLFEGVISFNEIVQNGLYFVIAHQRFSFLSFAHVFNLSILPSLIVGGWMSLWLLNDMENNIFSVRKSAIKGWLLGLFDGIGMCVYAYVLILYRSSFDRFVFLNITGIIITSFSGMLIGYQLSKIADKRFLVKAK